MDKSNFVKAELKEGPALATEEDAKAIQEKLNLIQEEISRLKFGLVALWLIIVCVLIFK